jgi:putative MFS transporter
LESAEGDLLDVGTMLINSQMFGMLIGGILWGVLGDKKGRLSVLFGSILLYSAANLANGFVTTVEQYAIIRFIAGIGLAGELGAGITLVTETMSKENRGYGTMIVAGVGLMGAVAAAIVGENYAWETSYIIGGIMGLLLLGMRVGLAESGMFKNLKNDGVSRGNIFMLFSDGKRFKKYLSCILIGIPLWFVVGVLVTFSPEFGKELNATEPLSAGTGIMYCYIGIAIGDVVAGFLSQIWRSRKKVMLVFLSAYRSEHSGLSECRGHEFATVYMACFIPGFFIRLLGNLCYNCIRAVWNESQGNSNHYGA